MDLKEHFISNELYIHTNMFVSEIRTFCTNFTPIHPLNILFLVYKTSTRLVKNKTPTYLAQQPKHATLNRFYF